MVWRNCNGFQSGQHGTYTSDCDLAVSLDLSTRRKLWLKVLLILTQRSLTERAGILQRQMVYGKNWLQGIINISTYNGHMTLNIYE